MSPVLSACFLAAPCGPLQGGVCACTLSGLLQAMNCKGQAMARAVGSYVNFTGLSKLPPCREEPCCQADSQRFLLSPESGDVKATIAVLSFILSSAAKHSVDSDSLSSELQQLGLPKEHATGLCRSYEEKQSPLQDSLRTHSLRLNHLDSVSWRVDQTLSSSELQQVNEPLVHLKFTVRDGDRGMMEPFAMTVSAEKFRVLLAELRQAHAMMKTLS
ncbi:COMM domain-containing protein 4 isoform X1 [Gopherus evgoodei]|uniref:COMM domain containing 4 n=1 Tax=Gopherus evgoodei TaxID=1825980 RepID=A0A8C4WH48_9SAUR|nr:COMM domain-containing protein 4 isoform X1 [Gopherus evgoodei]